MFLNVQEGLCFRNCLNKFNSWYPRLEEQTRDAAFRTYYDMTMELYQNSKDSEPLAFTRTCAGRQPL